MVRPKKDFKIQRNGNSLQFFEYGEYCGSLPIKFLCELARAERAKDTILENTQQEYINDDED